VVFSNGTQTISLSITVTDVTFKSLVLGTGAGLVVPPADKDTLLGFGSGALLTGDHNVFAGNNTGSTAVTSNNCTLIGDSANVGSDPLTFSAAIGSGAVVSANNMIQLGRAGAGSEDVTISRSLFQNPTVASSANLCSGASVGGAQTINLCSGATPGAAQTINLLNTTATTGAQQLNIANSASNTTSIAIGASSGTGAITVGLPSTFNKGIIYGNKAGTVTQITSPTTAVTSNAVAGSITTVSETVAAGANATFVFNNSFITSTSQVYVQISSYAGAGVPMIFTNTPGAGTVNIVVFNAAAATALNAVITFAFIVV